MDQALRAPKLRAAARMGTLLVGCLAFLLGHGRASAQLPLDVHGLRGGRYVGSAAPIDDAPRAILGLGYAYTEGVIDGDGTDRHQRLFGELAAGWAPWSYLQLSLGFDARYDKHTSDVSGSDSGGALGTRLATRHAFQLNDQFSLAARTGLRFPPASNVGRGFKGVSPEFGAIATYLFKPAMELSLDLGYRVDRSDETVDARKLRAGDRLAAQVSDFDQALLGALFALPLGPVTASAEFSWDIFVGSGAPSPGDSPMRVRLAAQTKLKDRYMPGIEVGVSPSGRPSLLNTVARIEPRAWFALTLGVSFASSKDVVRLPEQETTPVEIAKAEPASLEVHVVDPTGAPVVGADLQLAVSGERAAGTSDANGLAQFDLRDGLEHALSVSGDGYQPRTVTVQGTAGKQVLNVSLERALPEGQIKGTVRSLRGGQPVKARLTLQPLDKTVNTDDKGNFVVDVPPGQYTLQIEAQGYEPQTRNAQVERLGVTIIVVDLRRAPK